MADAGQGWKIEGLDVPPGPGVIGSPVDLGKGWTIGAPAAPAAAAPPVAPQSTIRGMEQLGALPGPPAPPRSRELSMPKGTEFINGLPVDKRMYDSPEPAESPIVSGAFQAIGGGWKIAKAIAPAAAHMRIPGMAGSERPGPAIDPQQMLSGGSDILEGAFQAGAPLLGVGAVEAPLATLGTLATAYGAAKGTEAGTKALGASPELSRFAGNVAAGLTVGATGRKLAGKLFEMAGSPEIKIGGKFPEPKPFAEMSDPELVAHANKIEADPPKNYDWQKQQIIQEVGKRQAARGMPAGEPTPPPAAPAAPADIGEGWIVDPVETRLESVIQAKEQAEIAKRAKPAEPPPPPMAGPKPIMPAPQPGSYAPGTAGPQFPARTPNLPEQMPAPVPEPIEAPKPGLSGEYKAVQQDEDSRKWTVLAKDGGSPIGTLDLIARPGELKVSFAHVAESRRGEGFGLGMYQRAAELARSLGKPYLSSGYSVTPDAARVWESLGGKRFTDEIGERWRIGTGSSPSESELAEPQATPPTAIVKTSDLDTGPPAPNSYANVLPSSLTLDPNRFQFKFEGVGQKGVSDQFKDVEKWNPDLAGTVHAWYDPANGKTYPVNGHHRTELAQRLGDENVPEGLHVRYLDAKDAQEARAKGALINIGEGNGTALDVGKFMRDTGHTAESMKAQEGIELSRKEGRQGAALAKLPESIFHDVVHGILPVERAAVLGSGLPNQADQTAIYQMMKDREASGKRLTNDQVEELIRMNQQAPEIQRQSDDEQGDMFGGHDWKQSVLPEKAIVSEYIRKQLTAEKKLFGVVSTQAAAERLGEKGNVIQASTNAQTAEAANQGSVLYDKLSALAGGPIDATLNRAAQRVAQPEKGDTANAAKQDAYREIRDYLKEQVDKLTGAGDRQRPESLRTGGLGPIGAGQRDSLDAGGSGGDDSGAAGALRAEPAAEVAARNPAAIRSDIQQAQSGIDAGLMRLRSKVDSLGEKLPPAQLDAVRKSVANSKTRLAELEKELRATGKDAGISVKEYPDNSPQAAEPVKPNPLKLAVAKEALKAAERKTKLTKGTPPGKARAAQIAANEKRMAELETKLRGEEPGQGPQLAQRVDEPGEPAAPQAQAIARTGAQLVDTLRVNREAADVFREAYSFAGGRRIGSFDGVAVNSADVRLLLKGLDGMAEGGHPAARTIAAELRKASAKGLRGVAIAGPEAEAHEQLHFAVDAVKFDPEKILDHGPTRVAVIEARSRGLAGGSDERVIREVMTRILNGEHETVKLDRPVARGILVNFLADSSHDKAGLDTLEELAHEQFKDTIGSATPRPSDSGTAPAGGKEPGPPAYHHPQARSERGDGGVGPDVGRDGEGEGPQLSGRDESNLDLFGDEDRQQLAHEQFKHTIGRARGLDDAREALRARDEPGPPADYLARPRRPSGDGGVAPPAGGEEGEGPEFARRGKPDDSNLDLFGSAEQQQLALDAKSRANKLLGDQLTAQLKSGGAARPSKLKPATNRGLFEEERPESGSLFGLAGDPERGSFSLKPTGKFSGRAPNKPGSPAFTQRLQEQNRQYGMDVREWFTARRDLWGARVNQEIERLKRLVPDPVDQEALSIYRDFKSRPGELKQWLAGTHAAYGDVENITHARENIEKLRPAIERAMKPTPEMLTADKTLTKIAEVSLAEGQKLGFIDKHLNPEEYVTHLLAPETEGDALGLADRAGRAMGGKIGRNFAYNQQRSFPTLLDAAANNFQPKTLNAFAAFQQYGDKFSTARATHLLIEQLRASDVGKWGAKGDKGIPREWVEIAPHAHPFRNLVGRTDEEGNPQGAYQTLFVPPAIEAALRPITDPDYTNKIIGFTKLRVFQAYTKAAQLSLSYFHATSENYMALANMGARGWLKALKADRFSPEFQEMERDLIGHGGTSPIQGRTYEMHPAPVSSLPTWAEAWRTLPGIRHIDKAAQSITEFTFDKLQRQFKVVDYATHKAAWLAAHPLATPAAENTALRSIAKEVNSVYGGLHLENLGINKMSMNVARAILLAPDWTFSNIFNVKYAMERGTPAGQMARMFWLRAIVGGMVATQAASLMLSRKLSKRPTQVYLGTDKDGKEIYQNIFFKGAPGDISNLIGNIKDYGPVIGLTKTVGNKMAPVERTFIDLTRNEDFLGRKIVPKGMNPIAGLVRGGMYAGRGLAPIPWAAGNVKDMLFGPDSAKYKIPLEVLTTLFAGTPPAHVADKPAKPANSLWEQMMTGKVAAPAARPAGNPVEQMRREQRRMMR